MIRRLACALSIAALALSAGSGLAGADVLDAVDAVDVVDVAEGDRLFSERAQTMQDDLADGTRIEQAIASYEAALRARPDDLALQWKLLRALHFAVDFSDLEETAKEAHAARAIELAEQAERGVANEQGEAAARVDDALRARLLFWSAIARGMQAQRVGLIELVRSGAARRLYENASAALELDPTVDRGGPLRLLSRLHATLPRVPFVTGWVDRDRALPLAERAYERDPEHPGNRLVLALTLLERAPKRAEQARALLESVIASEPRPEARAEDAAIQRDARDRLDAL